MTLTMLPGGRDTTTDVIRQRLQAVRYPKEPSTYEAVTRQMVEMIQEDVRDIKSKLNNLILVLIGTLILDFASRLLGM